MNLRNRLKLSIQTANTIKTTALIVVIIITAIVEAITVLIDGIVIIEAKRANAIYVRRRTAVYRDIYQRNGNAPRRYTKRNLIQTKAIIVILRTDISNILPFIKEIIRTNIIKPLKPLSQILALIMTLRTKILIVSLLLLKYFLLIKQLLQVQNQPIRLIPTCLRHLRTL